MLVAGIQRRPSVHDAVALERRLGGAACLSDDRDLHACLAYCNHNHNIEAKQLCGRDRTDVRPGMGIGQKRDRNGANLRRR
jgi:hypothetical protein